MKACDRAVPLRRLRRAKDKPPMPKILEPLAEKAKARHRKRHANPGVVLEVEKLSADGYKLASPHSDTDSWQAMICDALGTRSEAMALTFLYQLASLCQRTWHPDDENGGGEWVPDECELNMILNFVAGVKPKNEMQAALAAQMVAVHLMTMKTAQAALNGYGTDLRFAPITGKLARTFVMQTDAMAKLQGKKTTRHRITVKYERHDHRHVHFEEGVPRNERDPMKRQEPASLRNARRCQAKRKVGTPCRSPAMKGKRVYRWEWGIQPRWPNGRSGGAATGGGKASKGDQTGGG